MWLLVVYVELPAVSIVLWLHVIVHMRAVLTTEQIFSPVECVCGLESTNRLNVLRAPNPLTSQRADGVSKRGVQML